MPGQRAVLGVHDFKKTLWAARKSTSFYFHQGVPYLLSGVLATRMGHNRSGAQRVAQRGSERRLTRGRSRERRIEGLLHRRRSAQLGGESDGPGAQCPDVVGAQHLAIRKLNQPKKEAVSAEVSREPRAEMVPAGESASPDWS